MSKRIDRSGLIAALVSAGVAVGCVGVGLGAWAVGNREIFPDEVGGISIAADGAQGTFVSILNTQVTDGHVRFGTIVNDLGFITSEEDTEDLTFGISFQAVSPDNVASLDGVTIPVSIDYSEDLKKLARDGLITLPFEDGTSVQVVKFQEGKLVGIAGDNYTVSVEETSTNIQTVSLTFSFRWGVKFAGYNPVMDEVYLSEEVTTEGVVADLTEAYSAVNELSTLGDDTYVDIFVGR